MSNEVQDDLENTEQSEEIEESEVTSVEVTPDMLEEDSVKMRWKMFRLNWNRKSLS